MNELYYGDNLQVLRAQLAADSVDLIYLDPPFNSQRDYNLLFKSPKGAESEAQIEAFKDSWSWGEQAEREFDELLRQPQTLVAETMRSLRTLLGRNDMLAYLTMMANRLIELHRVLKPAGSLYLHCDPTAAHYLRIVLDAVFGKEMFRNELIWQRSAPKGHAFTRFPSTHDVLLFYGKSEQGTWTAQFQPQREAYLASHYGRVEEETGRRYALGDCLNPAKKRPNLTYEWHGQTRVWRWTREKMQELHDSGRLVYTASGMPRYKRYLDETAGRPVTSVWTDIPPINSQAAERLGYPTQKPLALLERIILASSHPGDVVLDPFCGCGTAVHAAHKLKRHWIGIDITHLAISLIEKRLKDSFGGRCKFTVHGTPQDLAAARDLAARDKYQFQWWAISLVEAQPFQGRKKGADGGVDGVKYFTDLDLAAGKKVVHKLIVSVKGGGLKPDDIRALPHVCAREEAEIALFISLDEPTKGMVADAAAAGFYTSGTGKLFPRVQLLSINGLLTGAQRAAHPDYEPDLNFKKAKAEPDDDQPELTP